MFFPDPGKKHYVDRTDVNDPLSSYSRFGFELLPDVVMPPPTNPARVLGYELVAGAWGDVAGPVKSCAEG